MKTTHSFATCGFDSPLGPMLLAASDHGLAGLWFEGQRHFPATTEGWHNDPAHEVLRMAAAQLQAYFDGRLAAFDLPLDLSRGTAFQQAVWQGLLQIPPRQTLSYGVLGERIGRGGAVRAVGSAVGRNPISIVVPCHRVLGKAGTLTGYAGGLERKSALLRLEGIVH